MEQALGIFSQLDGDSSILNQFVISVALFFVAKFLFLNKLQFVLENRNEKTTKLEEDAERKFQEANQYSNKYKVKVEQAYAQAQKAFEEKKNAIVNQQKQLLKQSEEEANAYIEASRKEYIQELEKKKSAIMGEADGLAESLVQKIVK